MRSRSGGNFTAFLMFTVLLAVPLLAVFGIPEFVPASISFDETPDVIEEIEFVSVTDRTRRESPAFTPSRSRDGVDLREANPNVLTRNRNRQPEFDGGAADQNPFLQFEEPGTVTPDQIFTSGRTPPAEALAGWEVGARPSVARQDAFHGHSAFERGFDSSETGQSIQPAFDPEERQREIPLTWTSAVTRLNDLGIRQYRLEPGSRKNEFLFCCFFTPRDNPRVTHKFESEAAEPLQAVENVLRQIDDWQQGR